MRNTMQKCGRHFMNFKQRNLFSHMHFLFSCMLKAQKPSVSGEDFEKLNDRAKALMIRLESLQKMIPRNLN